MRLKKYCLLFLFLMPAIGEAENAYDFGDYIVYYNAFTANTLPPTIYRLALPVLPLLPFYPA